MDLNKVMLIGNVTRDVESRTTTTGQNVVNFSVATNLVWTDQNGQKQERAEFHNIVAWRKLADIIQQYVKKGNKVYVEGRLQTRSWDDPQGQKHYKTEVVADNLIMLSSPSGANARPMTPTNTTPTPAAASTGASTPAPAAATPVEETIKVEDIPF